MDRLIVKELIQQYCTPKNISNELRCILEEGNYRTEMLNSYQLLNEKLGGAGASSRFAKLIVEDLKRSMP
jgi:lipid-A-disaccharide synthase